MDLLLPTMAHAPMLQLIQAQVARRKRSLEAYGHTLSTAAQVLSMLQICAR